MDLLAPFPHPVLWTQMQMISTQRFLKTDFTKTVCEGPLEAQLAIFRQLSVVASGDELLCFPLCRAAWRSATGEGQTAKIAFIRGIQINTELEVEHGESLLWILDWNEPFG